MSGWWLWALIGLYPLDPGSGELVVGVPMVDELTLHRDVGTLRVRVHRESPDAAYLAAASWNGRTLERPLLTPSDLAEPGLLELRVVGEPPVDSPLWRRPAAVWQEWRPDLCRPEFAVAAFGVDGGVAFDDGADQEGCCVLAAGDWIGQDFGARQPVTDLTLTTLDAADADAFVVEHSEDGLEWHRAITTHREPVPANRTTPFQMAKPAFATCWRVRATVPTRLRQLELFDLDRG